MNKKVICRSCGKKCVNIGFGYCKKCVEEMKMKDLIKTLEEVVMKQVFDKDEYIIAVNRAKNILEKLEEEGARERIKKLIKEYSGELQISSLGDRFITIGGVEELAEAIQSKLLGE